MEVLKFLIHQYINLNSKRIIKFLINQQMYMFKYINMFIKHKTVYWLTFFKINNCRENKNEKIKYIIY